ncbi:MAG: DUF441 domain-containing protein [Bacillota bacterium]
MNAATLLMLFILILGILGRSNVVAASAAIMLLIHFTNLQRLLPIIERRGLEMGLLFLMLSVLVPFAAGRVPVKDILKCFISVPGIIAIFSGALATYMNGKGLSMLQHAPQLMIGLVIGGIIGIIFFGGIPVGPLMAGGIAAILMHFYQLLK